VRGRLPPFLTTKRGFVGACLTFYGVVRLALDLLQDIDYLLDHAGSIASFLASTGGNALILGVGLFLTVWAALSRPPEAAGVVASAENDGPFTIEEWAPDEIGRKDTEVVCVVTYKARNATSAYFSDPVATIEVEDAGDDLLISVSYKVRGDGWAHHIAGAWGVQMDTGVHVLDAEGQPVRVLPVDMGWIEIREDGSWQHDVAGSGHLLGLPEGVYGLNVLDVTDVFLDFRGTNTHAYSALKDVARDAPVDLRSNTRREYRDMRLSVRKL
jgi:hypothetical protein